jgi:hypothetical protein
MPKTVRFRTVANRNRVGLISPDTIVIAGDATPTARTGHSRPRLGNPSGESLCARPDDGPGVSMERAENPPRVSSACYAARQTEPTTEHAKVCTPSGRTTPFASGHRHNSKVGRRSFGYHPDLHCTSRTYLLNQSIVRCQA